MNNFNHEVFLKGLVNLPGVYKFYDESNNIIYVGKASNLKKRVQSYFRSNGQTIKTKKLVKSMSYIDIITTNSETEALILENNLIKKHLPKYNILLRDDKSYPYIFVTDEAYPRLRLYRGNKTPKGKYFGPYPSVLAVKETIDILQKTFLLRNCNNTFFKNRSRPCLQYQINRCSAPCVGNTNEKEYIEQVNQAVSFLDGNSKNLLDNLNYNMQKAALEQRFEDAAILRDRIKNLRKSLEKQYIETEVSDDVDVISLVKENSVAVIQIFFYRNGVQSGVRSVYPTIKYEESEGDIMQSFLEQTYLEKAPPKEIVCNIKPENFDLLLSFFKEKYGRKVNFTTNPKKIKKKWQKIANSNALVSLKNKLHQKGYLEKQYKILMDALFIDKINKMACIDISHTMGEATVASFVVFDKQGEKKSEYRRYNVNGIKPGDDYAAIRFALEKRLSGNKESLPELIFIDGGLGQARSAQKILDKHNLNKKVLIVGIAKGVRRKEGEEVLILMYKNEEILKLSEDNIALHLIQQIRNESHRFAIFGHRAKREKSRISSTLEKIEGVGSVRRKELIKYFGGMKEVGKASIEELEKVSGINKSLAERIYTYFHGGL